MINFMSPLELEKLANEWDPDGTGILGIHVGLAIKLASVITENFFALFLGETLTGELGIGKKGRDELNDELKSIGSSESGANYFQRACRSLFFALQKSGWELEDIEVFEDGWSIRFSVKCGEMRRSDNRYTISTYSESVQ